MDKMTDARAVEVLAAMREDGGVVADADYTAAIDRAVARLRECAGVGGEFDAEAVAWAYGKLRDFGCYASEAGAMMGDRLNMMLLNPPEAAPQPPAEAQVCGCGEATCVEPWEPGCGLGSSAEHTVVAPEPPRKFAAEAQAQGGGEVDDLIVLGKAIRAEFAKLHAAMAGIRERAATPPSAPVGVEGLIAEWRAKAALCVDPDPGVQAAGAALECCADELEAALAQQPAAVDGDFIKRVADSLIAKGWDIDPDCDGTGVVQLREAVISALAAQPGGAE